MRNRYISSPPPILTRALLRLLIDCGVVPCPAKCPGEVRKRAGAQEGGGSSPARQSPAPADRSRTLPFPSPRAAVELGLVESVSSLPTAVRSKVSSDVSVLNIPRVRHTVVLSVQLNRCGWTRFRGLTGKPHSLVVIFKWNSVAAQYFVLTRDAFLRGESLPSVDRT